MEAKATKKSFTSLASAAKNTEHGPSSQQSPSSNQKESGNLNLTKKERLGRRSKKKHPQSSNEESTVKVQNLEEKIIV